MYVYMYLWEKRSNRVTFWFSVFGEIWICHETINIYSFCLRSHLEIDMIYLSTPSMTEWKLTSVEKTSIMLFGIYVKINNCVVKNIFIICLLLNRWMKNHKTLNKYLSSSISLGVYLFDIILLCPNFKRVHFSGKRFWYYISSFTCMCDWF